MISGQRTWTFQNRPVILSAGTAVGPFEGEGLLADDYDVIHEDLWCSQDSYEKAQKKLFEDAANQALDKVSKKPEDVQFIFAGDLSNQITSSSFACRTLCIPYFGLFGACSTSMEGLALAAFITNCRGADLIMTGAVSHNCVVEKTFRYPTEYGAQKPPSSQWTVTGAGMALLAQKGDGPVVTSATIGKVIDMGLSDPYNMGAAMAPAAVDTITAHLNERGVEPDFYDLIITGDLGKIGRNIALDLFREQGTEIDPEKFKDCGLLIYNDDQPVFAGASGAGCSATVLYGHLLRRINNGELNRILVVATGALLSPLTYQQKESIPCIAHAVAIESGGGAES
ncbi:stage V sporulation protein AD [Alteribacter natronophilus]|uniref:stage V sporulation protein AD n=1 Tax=Alteribacter natronophilus TaxID=2583810 RepID=UPI00110E03BD|nr:stage V sporulation protein AD [Alteribacter natronophilus]TMW73656.1 stage V sporulation protein AD [Alteribacter natronophilus]